MRVLAVPDKFRGTATAEQVCAAIAVAVVAAGSSCRSLPIADGGEGMLEAFGGLNRLTVVTGPAGGKASQDIAFKKASVAEASKKFFSDAAKALSQ